MGAAAGGKAGVGRPLWPAGTVWEGRPLLLARPGGQGEWARDLGPRHGVCTDRRAAGQKRCCHEPPVRARAGPASSLGHGVVIRSRSGPDAAPAGQACAQLDDTKRADEHRMSGPERGSTARARRRARARDERRRDRDPHGGSAPRPPGPLPSLARGSALPSPAPARRLPGFPRGPLTWSPAADGGRAGRRGDARSDGDGARRRAARGGRAGSRDELGRGSGGRGAGLPSSSLPPGRARARGAALGRGQRFFVSPAPSARHRGGGPHPGSGAGRFIRDRNVSDYTRVRKRLNKLYGILRNITQFSVDLRSPFS